MRYIKFRGKTAQGSWLYGDLRQRADRTSIVCRVFAEGKIFYKEFAVLPDTVGQFTGLHDNDGREIYEGDIIVSEDYSRARHYVSYHEDEAMFVAMIISSPLMEYCAIRQSWIDKFSKKIIGNIHDDAKLLNKPN